MKEEHPLKAVQSCNICGVYNQTKKLYASHMKVHRMEVSSCLMFDMKKDFDLIYRYLDSRAISKDLHVFCKYF